MATLKHALGDHHLVDQTDIEALAIEQPSARDTLEERRERRMAALKKTAGIWANRPDIPADGLEYQRQLRSEWQA